jgi:hypothetical protein
VQRYPDTDAAPHSSALGSVAKLLREYHSLGGDRLPAPPEVEMRTDELAKTLTRLFSELTEGTHPKGGFILNTGDIGLLRSLDKLSARDASQSTNGGATIATHAQHLRYGLSLMNDWGKNGGNPFANAKWDEAWKMAGVDDAQWQEIRNGLRDEIANWKNALNTPREAADLELMGIVGSIAHIAYHLGAIRQINKDARGPKEGTF